jgi:hypothetical protein
VIGEKSVWVLVGKTLEKDHLENQGVDGRMEPEWNLGRLVGGCSEFN